MSHLTIEQRTQVFAMRKSLDNLIVKIVDSTIEINENLDAIRPWKPGVYVTGDVRMYKGIPYKCVQGHDSTSNPHWTPLDVPALWMQYHGTTVETARPWIAPAGAHDMYRAGEYMIYTDGITYKCISDTAYSPTDYSQAWEVVTN